MVKSLIEKLHSDDDFNDESEFHLWEHPAIALQINQIGSDNSLSIDLLALR